MLPFKKRKEDTELNLNKERKGGDGNAVGRYVLGAVV